MPGIKSPLSLSSPRFYPHLAVFGVSLLIAVAGVFLTDSYYSTRFFPGTIIEGVNVGGLTPEQAEETLGAALAPLPNHTFTLEFADVELATTSAFLKFDRTTNETVTTLFTATHPKNSFSRLRLFAQQVITRPKHGIATTYSAEKVAELIHEFRTLINIQGEDATASLGISGDVNSLVIHRGTQGTMVDEKKTASLILNHARDGIFHAVAVTRPTSSIIETEEEFEFARLRAQQYVGASLLLESEFGSEQLRDTELLEYLLFPSEYHQSKVATLSAALEKKFNRPAQNAVFEYDPDTLEVSSFIPDRPGLTLDPQAFEAEFLSALKNIETSTETEKAISLTLPLQLEQATVTLAGTNDLGIKERIGLGESEYDHSIPSRIHNVSLTTSKITNYIIQPGEEFSFNKALGEVSRATGFQPAYVIRGGRTELGDGGGVCQVSTTLFRSVLDAGLPVTKRLQHSYRVSYYELNAKPGIDATVYSGNVDLRFRNDTGHHILIHAEADSTNLTMFVELYGTSDGRSAEIVDHTTWDYSPPPAPQYIEDPSLPPGSRKQIDWAVAGIKAKFTNVVRDANGEIIREDEYYSNYRPWSAKYLVGPAQ